MGKSVSKHSFEEMMHPNGHTTTPRPPRPVHQDVARLARRCAELALEKKATDIKIFEVSQLTSIADFFVICTGSVDTHVRGIFEHIEDKLRAEDIRPWHVEGRKRCQWILMDYVDVVVHVFQPETREFYGLERLWGDAKVEEIRDTIFPTTN